MEEEIADLADALQWSIIFNLLIAHWGSQLCLHIAVWVAGYEAIVIVDFRSKLV